MSKSSTTIEGAGMINRMRPIHLGEILREEFLVPIGMRFMRIPAGRFMMGAVEQDRRTGKPVRTNSRDIASR